tara:strand:- start:4144 stop:4476 length:333 start_codon:yes stop_codon:yes gene_type:complete
MRFVIDIDDTISEWDWDRDYLNFVPKPDTINKINELYDNGHYIILFTARGMMSAKGNLDDINNRIRPPLEQWLINNNVKHHELIMGKPAGDYYIDDKNLTIDQFVNGEFE